MRFLWEMTGKIFGAETQDGTFLSANVMCVAVYAGVIGGVIGGFLFLIHRHNGKQL